MRKKKTCSMNGKIIYVSRRKGRAAIKKIEGSGHQNKAKTGVFGTYICIECRGIHIGHSNRGSYQLLS